MEVRFEDLHIETSVYTESGRNVPNVLNAYRDIFEYAFLKVRTLLQVCHQLIIICVRYCSANGELLLNVCRLASTALPRPRWSSSITCRLC